MQRGLIYRVGKCWLLRYWETVLEDGKPVKRRVAKKLTTYSDQYRTVKSVEHLAQEILAPINARTARPESTDTVSAFLETYLVHCAATLHPSSVKTYRDLFRIVKPHLNGIRLREVRTPDVDGWLRKVAEEKQRAHTTHKHLKSFLSGAFRYARRTGAIDSANPVRDAAIPRGKPAGETHAYTLDEIKAMLTILPEPSRTLVLVAGLTGLRLSEVKGLRWEDYSGNELRVSRSVWNGVVSETKTPASKASIPLLSVVAEALEAHRARTTGAGFIFTGATGKPIRPENVLRRDMLPALDKAGLTWHGWHAFRRGLATNLYSLGAPDKTVQAILRHANVSTTMAYYVKPVAADSHAAMRKLESAFESARRSA